MTEIATPAQTPRYRSTWKWFLAIGAILLVLGLTGIGAATLLQLASLLVFGPMLLASSIMQFLAIFFVEKWQERLLHFACCIGAGPRHSHHGASP
jgi:uncharacterized membrane protein HdeD (DUF308 family)